MHKFKYKKNRLFCEDVAVDNIAGKFGTPFYLYSKGTLVDHYEKIKKAFTKMSPVICFSVKANSNLAVLKSIVSKGAGLDIVSAGELYRAKKVGCPSDRIVYAGVGKRPDEIEDAIKNNILLFNVESEPELETINRTANKLNKKVDVALRLNPDVEAKTHKYIATGKKENKFGMDFITAAKIFKKAADYRYLDITGVHIHIGSQITESAPFVKAIKKTLAFIDSIKVELRYFNIGGGLGIVYSKEDPQTALEFANTVIPCFKGRRSRLILEPGRFIAGNSGILVTKVVYVKKNASGKLFAICDAGMNDLLRPSLYAAHHEVIPVRKSNGRTKKKYDIVGPICETGDFLAKDRYLKKLKAGDLIAVMSAGAYGFTMSSNYNSRPRIQEILVSNNRKWIVRKKENFSDLIKGEIIPKGV